MRKSIVFVAMNGKGVEPLLGTLAVAKKLRRLNSELEIVFFTTSMGVEWIRNEQFLFYYFPDKGNMPTFITPSLWNNYVKKRLEEVIQIHNPMAIVYDGAYPYTAVLSQLNQKNNIQSFWIRKGNGRKESRELDLAESMFEHTILELEAGEVSSERESGKRIYTPAALFLEPQEVASREVVRKKWGIQPDRTVVYIQLAKEGDEREEETRRVLDVLLGKPEYEVILGGTKAERSLEIKRTLLTVVKDYPHAKNYLGADFVISGVEYMTYHELLYFGVPAILIPAKGNQAEVENERAKRAHKEEAALYLGEYSPQMIDWGIDYLATHKQNMSQNAKRMMPINGADMIARYILCKL